MTNATGRAALWVGCLLLAALANAAEPNVEKLYEVTTEGSSSSVKAGEKGVWKVALKTQPGAHISDEAPLKIELSGTNVQLEKGLLRYGDSVAQKQPGEQYAQPRFEVPFTASSKGEARVDAKMSFFVCTDKVCARQQKQLSVPIRVE